MRLTERGSDRMGTYRTLFYAGLIVALIFLLAAIILFFVLKIPKAFGVVTGRTEKKAIEEIRASGYGAKAKKDALRKTSEKIHVRDAEMDTGSLRARDSAETEEKSSRTVDRGLGLSSKLKGRRGRSGKNQSLENEETEILGYGDEGSAASALKTDGFKTVGNTVNSDATDVLSGDSSSGGFTDVEAATDVLSGGGSAYSGGGDSTDVLTAGGNTYSDDGGSTDVLTAGGKTYSTGNEDATDVLTSGGRSRGSEEETDVLTSGTRYDEADDATDVLTSPHGNEVPEDEEIVGRYSAEETAVLRSIHTRPDEEDTEKDGEIQILLSETIVHTEESL